MIQYLDLLRHVLENGEFKPDRTGTGTLSVFGAQARFPLQNNFPALTTKKLHLRSIIYERLWFLRGETNVRYQRENNVAIWDERADGAFPWHWVGAPICLGFGSDLHRVNAAKTVEYRYGFWLSPRKVAQKSLDVFARQK